MKKKTTMKEKAWKFFDSHPKALMLLDMIDVVSSKFMLIYTVFFAVVLIGIPVCDTRKYLIRGSRCACDQYTRFSKGS